MEKKYIDLRIFFIVSLVFLFRGLLIGENSKELSISEFLVALDGSGNFSSIQAAINAAVEVGGNATVWIKNGSYFEDLSLYSGVNLVGASGLGDLGDVEITGVHTPPISGHIVLRNIRWNGLDYILFSEEAGTCHITVIDALLNVQDGYSFYLPNWDGLGGGALELQDVNPGFPEWSQDGGVYNPYGRAKIFIYNAGLGIGTEKNMFLSGPVNMLASCIGCALQLDLDAELNCNSSVISRIIFEGSSFGNVSNTHILSETGPAITMNSTGKVSFNTCVIDGTQDPVISGNDLGVFNINGCAFPNKSKITLQHDLSINDSMKVGALEMTSMHVLLFTGIGAPSYEAPKGSLYLRIDGYSSTTRIYINIDGSSQWTYVQSGQ
ncbi:hypothetical protein [Simkania sp.]|uniref:hypothetical protein n=1 Tax=Simkania sp. TaxID=34094 RepID=UPI003B51B86B